MPQLRGTTTVESVRARHVVRRLWGSAPAPSTWAAPYRLLNALLERAAQSAVEKHVTALLLALVDQDHDGGDEQWLVGLHDAPRAIETEVLQPAAELVQAYRHRSTISRPDARSTCGSRASIAHTALDR